MAKKKILFIYGQMGKGGISEVLISILKSLNREKYDPVLLSYIRESGELFTLPVQYRYLDLPMTSSLKQIIFFIRRIFKIAEIINELKPDIVLSSFNRVNVNTALAIKWARHKPKFIAAEHTALSVELGVSTATIARKKKQYPDKSFVDNWLHRLANRVLILLIKKLYHGADRIITVSEGIKNELKENFGLYTSRISVIYNPVDTDRIKKLSAEAVTEHSWFSEDIPIIITAGRLTKQKAHILLISAYAKVCEKIPCRLVLLGEGEYIKILRKKVDKLNLNDFILFMGYQKNPFKFISRSKVFALSSIYEGFPMVILESMACGTPVVSTDCPTGPSEIINPNVNGILVKMNDIEGMASAILKVLSDSKFAENIALNAKETVKKYSLENSYSQYEKIFEEIC